jgi:hypothetical protein
MSARLGYEDATATPLNLDRSSSSSSNRNKKGIREKDRRFQGRDILPPMTRTSSNPAPVPVPLFTSLSSIVNAKKEKERATTSHKPAKGQTVYGGAGDLYLDEEAALDVLAAKSKRERGKWDIRVDPSQRRGARGTGTRVMGSKQGGGSTRSPKLTSRSESIIDDESEGSSRFCSSVDQRDTMGSEAPR